MAKNAKQRITCAYFSWNLIRRRGVYYGDGRRNRSNLGKHSLGTKDYDTALEALRQLDRRKAIELGIVADEPPLRNCRLPIDDIWRRYLEYCGRPDVLHGVVEGTLKRYRPVRDKHVAFCRQRLIDDWSSIDKKSVEQYGTHLKKEGYADATVYLECTLIKQVINWLIDEEKFLPESRRIRLPLRRSQESSTYCYTRAQVQAMVVLCTQKVELQWLADLIVALAHTGMRISEAISLRWVDVDLSINMLTLRDNRHSAANISKRQTTKGRRGRQIPIHPQFRLILERLPHRSDGRVFGGPHSGVLKADIVRNVLVREVINVLKERFRSSPDFEDGRLHSFRHYFVSQAFLTGASEGEIREWVGHKDSRLVERYRHLRADEAQRRMTQLSFLDSITAVADDNKNVP